MFRISAIYFAGGVPIPTSIRGTRCLEVFANLQPMRPGDFAPTILNSLIGAHRDHPCPAARRLELPNARLRWHYWRHHHGLRRDAALRPQDRKDSPGFGYTDNPSSPSRSVVLDDWLGSDGACDTQGPVCRAHEPRPHADPLSSGRRATRSTAASTTLCPLRRPRGGAPGCAVGRSCAGITRASTRSAAFTPRPP